MSYFYPKQKKAIAGNIHIGQLLGANKPAEARNAVRVLQVFALCLVSFLCVVILLLSNYWGSWFSDNMYVSNINAV